MFNSERFKVYLWSDDIKGKSFDWRESIVLCIVEVHSFTHPHGELDLTGYAEQQPSEVCQLERGG